MIAPDYSLFIHALAAELDLQAGPEERDALLHSVGQRIATRLPLPECETVEAFELECNALLSIARWGVVSLRLQRETRALYIELTGFPTVGSLGNPAGQWLSAFYGGVLEGWLAQLDEHVTLRLDRSVSRADQMVFLFDLGSEAPLMR